MKNVRRVREQAPQVILGKNGNVLEGRDAVKRRWGEYFGSFLNENNER